MPSLMYGFKSNLCRSMLIGFLFLVFSFLFGVTNQVAVMSIDLGSEWMKVATVSPGVPMDIALNKESKRKTPVSVAFRDGERHFGEDALILGTRFPKQQYFYLLEVLGKKFEHPQVQRFRERFPYYDIFPDPDTGSVIFRHDEQQFNESMQKILFFDVGATSTVVTLAGYQLMKSKERGVTESHPQLTILGVGTLGGLELQIRLRDHLALQFDKDNGKDGRVFESHRAMTKLLREAARVKNVLSANTQYMAQVESLLGDTDFKALVTRTEFEDLYQDLLERLHEPLDVALQQAELTLADVDQVILMGGATRTPAVQKKLQELVGKELGKSVNADEAAALGAALRAAELAKGFKIKKFLAKDAVLFPIVVDFQKEDPEQEHKIIRRILFGPLNPYPQKKVMTFSRHVHDFVFYVNLGDLQHLPERDLPFISFLNLTEVDVRGINSTLEHYPADRTEHRGVKVHFVLDDSGLLSITGIENIFEVLVDEDESDGNEESTLSRLGNTISKLFGGAVPEVSSPPVVFNLSDAVNNLTSVNQTAVNDTENVGSKLHRKTLKVPVEQINKWMDLKDPTTKFMQASQAKLHRLDLLDQQRKKREAAFNGLESFILDTQNRLSQEEYQKASGIEEQTNILKRCSEDGIDAPTEVYQKKLSELQLLTRDLYDRVREHQQRPEALQALHQMLNVSRTFLAQVLNSSLQDFTQVELLTLQKLVNDTEEWKKVMIKEQDATPLFEPVKLTVLQVAEKMAALDREIKYLINKARNIKAQRMRKEAEELLWNATLHSQNDTHSNDTYKSNEEESDLPGENVTEENLDVGDQSPADDGLEKDDFLEDASSTLEKEGESHEEL